MIVPTITAVNDVVSVVKTQTSVRVNVLANDIPAVAGSTLTVKQTGSSVSTAGATVSYSPTHVDYFPRRGYLGVDTFTYAARDSQGREGSATVSVTVGECQGVVWIGSRILHRIFRGGRAVLQCQ